MPHPNYYVKIQKKRETSNSRGHFFTAKSDKKNGIQIGLEVHLNAVRIL